MLFLNYTIHSYKKLKKKPVNQLSK